MHAVLAELGDTRFELVEDGAQIRPPDVAAVDRAERDDAVVRDNRKDG